MSKLELYNNKNYFIEVSKQILLLTEEVEKIDQISRLIYQANKEKNKVLVAGNGGSCADAEHFVGELVCTFSDRNRGALSALNLSSSNAALTAWSNDFSFESFIKRQVLAHGKPGDILILISTGGGSPENGSSMNLVEACDQANSMNIKTISLIGKDGGLLKNKSDDYILINSKQTSVIQECHMSILHAICNNLDILMFNMN
jgi:D-sedoheptulose 7-phosphate isomerase